MPTYTTDSVSTATSWLTEFSGLADASRSSLIKVLNSPQFGAALRRTQPTKIVIEYERGRNTTRIPRRVLLEVDAQPGRVAITGDRGCWVFSLTGDSPP
jgi:hypothetical protein